MYVYLINDESEERVRKERRVYGDPSDEVRLLRQLKSSLLSPVMLSLADARGSSLAMVRTKYRRRTSILSQESISLILVTGF